MNRKALLRAWVKIGLLAGVVGFAAVFVYGLFTPGTVSSGDVVDVGGLPEESARLVAWHGRPVWVVHRSAGQLAALAELSGHVRATPADDRAPINVPHRSVRRSYGVYLAETARSGVLVQFVRRRPDGMRDDTPWHGGFVDPGSDAVFDLAGRRYRSTRGGPLPVPPHRYTASGSIRLGEW